MWKLEIPDSKPNLLQFTMTLAAFKQLDETSVLSFFQTGSMAFCFGTLPLYNIIG